MKMFDHLMAVLYQSSMPRAILLLFVGYGVSVVVRKAVEKITQNRLNLHYQTITKKIAFYTVLLLFIVSVIQELGFHISALLGATGVLTIFIGIASQASFSNIISGIFIFGEAPFQIGDTIKVNDVQGEVLSIDLLSVRIRVSDNTMVRIPNDTLSKASIINLSFFPIRRLDLLFSVIYNENIQKIKNILLNLCEQSDLCLEQPHATVIVSNLGDIAVTMQLQVWTRRENYNQAKSFLLQEIAMQLIAQGIAPPLLAQSRTAASTNRGH